MEATSRAAIERLQRLNFEPSSEDTAWDQPWPEATSNYYSYSGGATDGNNNGSSTHQQQSAPASLYQHHRYENWPLEQPESAFAPPPPLPPRPRPKSLSVFSDASSDPYARNRSWDYAAATQWPDQQPQRKAPPPRPPPPRRPPPPASATRTWNDTPNDYNNSRPTAEVAPYSAWDKDTSVTHDNGSFSSYRGHGPSCGNRDHDTGSDRRSRSYGGDSFMISGLAKNISSTFKEGWEKSKEKKREREAEEAAASRPTIARKPSIPVKPPSYSTGAPGDVCLKCHDFSAVDSHAALFPRHSVHSVSTLARDLTALFPAPLDKARVIFIWLHHNIDYDTTSFFGNNVRHKTPDQTIRTGLAVCQGYAELFTALAGSSGLESAVVSGYGKGFSHTPLLRGAPIPTYKSNHAWNAVRMLPSEGWWLIDCCWGAGHVTNARQYERQLNTAHFTSTPEVFRRRHFPGQAKYQFCSQAITWEEYISLPQGPTLCSRAFGSYEFSPDDIEPSYELITPGTETTFVLRSKCQHSAIAPGDQHVLLLHIGGDKRIPLEPDAAGATWTCRVPGYKLKDGDKVKVQALTTFGGRSGQGLTVEEYRRRVGRAGWSSEVLCSWRVGFA